MRDRDVTLGGEESSGISPDVNRVQNRGGRANEGQATLPGQGAKSYREMRPLEAAGRCGGPGSTARGSARTDWGGRARESASARRGRDRAAGRGSGRCRGSGAERSRRPARPARSPGGWRRRGGARTFRGPLAPTRPGVRPAAVGDGWRRGGAGADGDLALALAPREGGVEARPAAGAAITVWAAEFSWCLSGRCDNGVRPRERSSRSAQARRAPPRALRPALSAGSLGSGLEGGARQTRGGACSGRL